LSLDEVIKFAETIDNWNFHGDYFKGFSFGRAENPTVYIGVEKVQRVIRSPTFHVWVECGMNRLADYTNRRAERIYDLALTHYAVASPADRKIGLSEVRRIISSGAHSPPSQQILTT